MRMIVMRELGRIAHYAYSSAQNVTELTELLDSEEIMDAMKKMFEETIEMHGSAFNSFVKRDMERASSVIDKMDEVRRMCEMIHVIQSGKGGREVISSILAYSQEGMKIAGHAVALADGAILAAFA